MKAVVYDRDAVKDLRRHGHMSSRIRSATNEYTSDPKAHANNVTQLVGSPAKRMRVGDFRLIFDETETVITVTKVDPRGDVHD